MFAFPEGEQEMALVPVQALSLEAPGGRHVAEDRQVAPQALLAYVNRTF